MASRLNTMQQIIHILKVKKTWAAASNTESSLSRRVLSIGSCMKNFIKPEKKTFDTDLARAGKSTDNAGSALPVQIQDSATHRCLLAVQSDWPVNQWLR